MDCSLYSTGMAVHRRAPIARRTLLTASWRQLLSCGMNAPGHPLLRRWNLRCLHLVVPCLWQGPRRLKLWPLQLRLSVRGGAVVPRVVIESRSRLQCRSRRSWRPALQVSGANGHVSLLCQQRCPGLVDVPLLPWIWGPFWCGHLLCCRRALTLPIFLMAVRLWLRLSCHSVWSWRTVEIAVLCWCGVREWGSWLLCLLSMEGPALLRELDLLR